MKLSQLPLHVRDVFHADAGEPQAMGVAWDYGWRVGNIVFSQVVHPDRAAWSARVREKLDPQGLRIVRPLTSTDGRYVSAGWRANSFVEGVPARRGDETVAAALRLDDVLKNVEVSDSLIDVDRSDLFSVADHLAWSENPASFVFDDALPAHEAVAPLVTKLSRFYRPIDAPRQVCHADMFATTIYSGTQAPAVTDLVGCARPYGYTAALAIVDLLVAEAQDEGVMRRFEHIPNLDQLLLRALNYRLFVHALHPLATSNAGSNLSWVSGAVMSKLSDTL